MSPLRATSLSVLAGALAACAHGDACGAGRACGGARWLEGAAVEGRFATAWAVEAVSERGASSEAMPVRARRTFVRFDAAALRGATVERAVLKLTAHPAWRPEAAVALTAREVARPWTARDVARGAEPSAGDESARVTLPPGLRASVRLDVTGLVRRWAAAGDVDRSGLALETDRGECVFVGPGASDLDARPKLELVLR